MHGNETQEAGMVRRRKLTMNGGAEKRPHAGMTLLGTNDRPHSDRHPRTRGMHHPD